MKTDRLRETMRAYMGGCESPIEELLASAICCQIGLDMLERAGDPPYSAVVPACQVVPQHPVGTYRVDIALIGPSVQIAIECDGHDFHEKTKEQAARDKARDRAITTAGFAMLRFTGSEIYADPMSCAEQAMALVTLHQSNAALAAYEARQ